MFRTSFTGISSFSVATVKAGLLVLEGLPADDADEEADGVRLLLDAVAAGGVHTVGRALLSAARLRRPFGSWHRFYPIEKRKPGPETDSPTACSLRCDDADQEEKATRELVRMYTRQNLKVVVSPEDLEPEVWAVAATRPDDYRATMLEILLRTH